jgi:hypothetical protein
MRGTSVAGARPWRRAELGQETTPTIAALLKRSTDALDPQLRQRFACLGLFVPKPATFDLGALAGAWGVTVSRATQLQRELTDNCSAPLHLQQQALS